MKLSFDKLRPHIAEVLDVAPGELQLTTVLNGSERWDSFSMLASVALITKFTGQQVTIDDVLMLATVEDFIVLFERLKGC